MANVAATPITGMETDAPIRELHIAINVAMRREGGLALACDGPDCVICRVIADKWAAAEARASQLQQERDATVRRSRRTTVAMEKPSDPSSASSAISAEAIRALVTPLAVVNAYRDGEDLETFALTLHCSTPADANVAMAMATILCDLDALLSGVRPQQTTEER